MLSSVTTMIYIIFLGFASLTHCLEFSMTQPANSPALFCGELKCSIDAHAPDNLMFSIFSIIGVTIYDNNQLNSSTKLAAVSVINPIYTGDILDNSTSVVGNISTSSAYLGIKFHEKSFCESGNYVCEVQFINTSGLVDAIRETNVAKRVSEDTVGLGNCSCADLEDRLNKEVSEQKQRAETLEEKLSQLTDRVSDLEKQLCNQDNLVIAERLTKAEKNLDYLTNRGHCYRGMERDPGNQYQKFEVDSDRQKYAVCDTQTDNMAWIVIQRRGRQSENFERDWTDYEWGFGETDADHWIGLDTIHQLSHKGDNELWIDLKMNGTDYTAVYTNFRVGNYSTNYVMSYESFIGGPHPANDAFPFQQNMPFTTYDKDNDNKSNGNCAQMYSGGWWYNDCYWANLNGRQGDNSSKGMNWNGHFVSNSEMKIRIYSEW